MNENENGQKISINNVKEDNEIDISQKNSKEKLGRRE